MPSHFISSQNGIASRNLSLNPGDDTTTSSPESQNWNSAGRSEVTVLDVRLTLTTTSPRCRHAAVHIEHTWNSAVVKYFDVVCSFPTVISVARMEDERDGARTTASNLCHPLL